MSLLLLSVKKALSPWYTYRGYRYDYDGTLISFNYDSDITDQYSGLEYFYIRNQMGDITHIATSDGTVVVHYIYDAYGRITDTDITAGYSTIANANPYRYRGYRYDSEISMYYLNSRFYNPEVGRFINSDGLLGDYGDIQTTNMYSYCHNNPIANVDPSGYLSIGLFRRIISSVVVGIPAAVVGFVIAGLIGAVTAAVVAVQAVNNVITAHYDRNDNNVDLPENKDQAIQEGWDDSVAANCHQFSAIDGPNVKFVSPDGFREVIYDSSGNMVTDPRDIGTYNYSPSGTFFGSIGHMAVDVVPWVLWGNSEDDDTNIFERAASFFGI
ncbi:MAG: RHS repeat-associated core domain-containing protein [Candidatus Izemoplasmatales bacterium]